MPFAKRGDVVHSEATSGFNNQKKSLLINGLAALGDSLHPLQVSGYFGHAVFPMVPKLSPTDACARQRPGSVGTQECVQLCTCFRTASHSAVAGHGRISFHFRAPSK